MKDHEIAQVVNALTEVAKTYGHTQQLRERIAQIAVPAIRGEFPKSVISAYTEQLPDIEKSVQLMQRIERIVNVRKEE